MPNYFINIKQNEKTKRNQFLNELLNLKGNYVEGISYFSNYIIKTCIIFSGKSSWLKRKLLFKFQTIFKESLAKYLSEWPMENRQKNNLYIFSIIISFLNSV